VIMRDYMRDTYRVAIEINRELVNHWRDRSLIKNIVNNRYENRLKVNYTKR